MKKLNYLLIALIIFSLIAMLYFIYFKSNDGNKYIGSHIPNRDTTPTKPAHLPTQTSIIPDPIPKSKVLVNNYYVKQTFNNCGPASLSMALSYFGIQKSQNELGQILRPYQHPTGNNDDKSVTLTELANYAKTYGFQTYHRPNGDIELLKNS